MNPNKRSAKRSTRAHTSTQTAAVATVQEPTPPAVSEPTPPPAISESNSPMPGNGEGPTLKGLDGLLGALLGDGPTVSAPRAPGGFPGLPGLPGLFLLGGRPEVQQSTDTSTGALKGAFEDVEIENAGLSAENNRLNAEIRRLNIENKELRHTISMVRQIVKI